jgi:hypothetical protein
MTGVYYFTLAKTFGDVSKELMSKTDVNATDLGKLYLPNTLLSNVTKELDELLGSHYTCS